MGYKILTLSPGSTSTKVAVFDGTEALFRLNVTHPAEELAAFDSAADQFDSSSRTSTPSPATAARWAPPSAASSPSTTRSATTS